MDITKVPNERKLELCRTYFRAGFAFLPFAWAVNVAWFFNEAFNQPPYEQQKQIRSYVLFSALGATLWLIILIAWIVIFQTYRASWGEIADKMSFIIPLGIP